MTTVIGASSLMGITQAELDRLASATTITNGTISSTSMITPGTFYNSSEPVYTPAIDSPGMKASLQELADLWAARFGDDWVPFQSVRDDEFWHTVVERLYKKDFLEEMRVASHKNMTQITVYRLCK